MSGVKAWASSGVMHIEEKTWAVIALVEESLKGKEEGAESQV